MTFTEALRAAMDTPDGREYITRVKRVVNGQLQSLDDSAHVEDTQYFNHSSVPDFVLTWPGESGSRNVYLRDSYGSIAAAHDGLYLTAGDPVLLSLEEDDPSPADSQVREESGNSRMLVTDAQAVELVAESTRESGPVSGMIRANFMRGARGQIDAPVAARLIDANGPHERQRQASIIAANFFEDAAVRITRTAQLIDLALGGVNADSLEAPVVGGRLSLAELRHVLPWLLEQSEASTNRRFWRRVGQMMTFADLESIRSSLESLDLDPLVSANADHWEVRWGYLGLATPVEGDRTFEQRRSHWSFARGALGIDYGHQRLTVASNGKLMPKNRGSRTGVTWERLSQQLAGLRLSEVQLQGARRSVVISTNQSQDVRADADEVTQSLEDRYFATSATVLVPAPVGEEGVREVQADVDTAFLRSPGGVSLEGLVSVASSVFGLDSQKTEGG